MSTGAIKLYRANPKKRVKSENDISNVKPPYHDAESKRLYFRARKNQINTLAVEVMKNPNYPVEVGLTREVAERVKYLRAKKADAPNRAIVREAINEQKKVLDDIAIKDNELFELQRQLDTPMLGNIDVERGWINYLIKDKKAQLVDLHSKLKQLEDDGPSSSNFKSKSNSSLSESIKYSAGSSGYNIKKKIYKPVNIKKKGGLDDDDEKKSPDTTFAINVNSISVVNCVAYSPTGHQLAIGSSRKNIYFFDPINGDYKDVFEGHTDEVYSIAYNPNGRQLASGSADSTVRLWSLQSKKPSRKTLRGHTRDVLSVAYSPDGRQIASGSSDKTIRLWDSTTGVQIGEPIRGHTSAINSVTYSPDGRQIASCSNGGVIRICESTGVYIGEMIEPTEIGPGGMEKSNEIYTITYSPDGRQIAAASDKGVTLWDVQTMSKIGQPIHHIIDDPIVSVAYNPNGRQLAFGSDGGTVTIWQTRTKARTTSKEVQSMRHNDGWGIKSVAYRPDGNQVVAGYRSGVILFLDTRKK